MIEKDSYASNTQFELQQSSRGMEEIQGWLVNKLASLLQMDPSLIDVREHLAGYGMGSLQMVQLASDLEEWIGYELPATLAWDYPTIEELTVFLSSASAAVN